MKKTLVVVFALCGLFLVSCNRENILASAVEDLTEIVQLSAARVAAVGDSVTKQKCKGKLTELSASDLPNAAKLHISSQYAGAEIQFVGKDEKGQFVVGIKLPDGTHKGLLFNADGSFNKELEKYHRRAKLTKVEIAALPAAVSAYISSKYAGFTAKKAGKNDAGELFVVIEPTTGTDEEKKAGRKVLQFNADGSFNQEMTPPAHPDGKKKRGR
ncbi:MAG: hypothetical protein ACK4GN_03685 [Runella sp.]